MGSLLRSDPMVLCHIYLQPETAFDVVSELGEMSCVEFIDLNPNVQAFGRNYIEYVCRCAEMERQLRYMHGEMVKDNIPIPDLNEPAKAMLPSEMMFHEQPFADHSFVVIKQKDLYKKHWVNASKYYLKVVMQQRTRLYIKCLKTKNRLYPFSFCENLFEKWENDISAVSENLTTIMKTYLELQEMQYVLKYIGPMLGNADVKTPPMYQTFKAAGDQSSAGQLVVTTGVVRRARCFHFEIMLWRVSRGNMFYRQASDDKVFEDPYTGKGIRKVAFLAVCQGTQLGARLDKVFTGFGTTQYFCPETLLEREAMMNKLNERLWDMEQVISNSKYLRCKALVTVAKNWRKWMTQVRKAKAIYHTFSYCYKDITKECLIGQVWIPEQDVPKVNDLLTRSSEKIGSYAPSFLSKVTTTLEPPTFQRTNRFTHAFQVLINAYGISQYRELNPGLYTIITFPFLFAMMFGDCGHAIILVLSSSWMIYNEKKFIGKTENEIWKIFFGGRYVILLLGLFSINSGLVYNDWFGKAIGYRSSFWKCDNVSVEYVQEHHYIDIDPSGKMGTPYPFGLDPIWPIASNKILVQNSIKMKLSIIIGVLHMIFGLTLSFFNYLYFKRTYSIILQYIPELIFLCCFFLWLVILIFFKWFSYSGQHPDVQHNTACAPQILLLFIDMVLVSESKPPAEGCLAYMFENQRSVQNALLLIGLLCIPILLVGSPTFIYFRDYRGKGSSKGPKKKGKGSSNSPSQFRRYQRSDDEEAAPAQKETEQKSEGHGGDHAFSEIMIHQAIHTIEFVLSTISHTASYLRLWALSLAHSQLSDMLWDMVLSKLALQDTSLAGVPKLFIIFSMWAFFTISILVVMEGLSAFLHTLRLHWVEFMSKFYTGGGIQFKPLCFRSLLEQEGDKLEAGCKKKAGPTAGAPEV